MRNLRKFAESEGYEEYKESRHYRTPNICKVVEGKVVIYNPRVKQKIIGNDETDTMIFLGGKSKVESETLFLEKGSYSDETLIL